MANKTKESTEKVVNKTDESTEEMVEIKIPLERGKANKDVYVAVNGRPYQVKRGVAVNVPKSVAKVLQQAEKQLLKSMEYQEAMASE